MGILSEKALAALPASEFERWWHSPGHWVEPANQRRGGESGVRLLWRSDQQRSLLYCKQQTGHTHRSLRYPFGRPTILRELHAYRAFARLGIRTPNLVYCAARQQQGNWQALLVTEALQGFVSLEQWYADAENRGHDRLVLRQLAKTLACLHRSGWQHGCCYPKHIFVRLVTGADGSDSAEVALLDMEKSRRRWFSKSASRRDLSQLERHRGGISESDMAILFAAYHSAFGRRHS